MYLILMINMILISLDMMVMILISIAFLTLLERKVLGYMQIRKGPNKVGFLGILQPFADAIKLFSKEMSLILKSNYLYYMFSPMLSMMIMLLMWFNIPMMSNIINTKFNLLMLLCILSMGVYGMMIAGWSSNSMYSLIGSLRSIAQTVSYEVSMILIMLSLIFLIESFNLIKFSFYQNFSWFSLMNFPMLLIFFVSFLAELNRTPFDFAEGESELVSGFNTEYMSGSFALIFIAEYGMIMVMMMLFNIFFFGSMKNILFYLMYMYLIYLILWVRATYPRFRYDNLMYLTWMSFLPISLNYLIIILSIKMILNY